MSEDERDRVLEELHKAEDSLLAADETAAKVPRARAARTVPFPNAPTSAPETS